MSSSADLLIYFSPADLVIDPGTSQVSLFSHYSLINYMCCVAGNIIYKHVYGGILSPLLMSE